MNRWLIIVAVVGLLAALRSSVKWTLPAAGKVWKHDFASAESLYNLPVNLLARVAQQESSFRPDVVSPAGAVGLMQIVPRWHPDVDPTDPIASIYYAGKYLRQLYNRFGTWSEALAAYNWGQGNLDRLGLSEAPAETRNYVADITGDLGLV